MHSVVTPSPSLPPPPTPPPSPLHYTPPTALALLLSAVEYRLIIREAATLSVVQLYSSLDRIEHLEWSPNSMYVMCGLFSRAIIQIWSAEQSDWACKIDEGPAGVQVRGGGGGSADEGVKGGGGNSGAGAAGADLRGFQWVLRSVFIHRPALSLETLQRHSRNQPGFWGLIPETL